MDTNKILAKIRALLQMTEGNGCTESEAMIASEKANSLMLEYNLSMVDIEAAHRETLGMRGKKFGSGSSRRRVFHPAINCMTSVAEFCECKCFLSGQDTIFFGSETNTEFAHYLMDMIRSAMDVEYRSHENGLKRFFAARGEKVPHGKTLRASFMVGMANRINQRLRELRRQRDGAMEQAVSNGRDLILVKDQELNSQYQAALKARGTALTKRQTVHKINAHSFAVGTQAGDRVNLGRPVGGSAAAALRLR